MDPKDKVPFPSQNVYLPLIDWGTEYSPTPTTTNNKGPLILMFIKEGVGLTRQERSF